MKAEAADFTQQIDLATLRIGDSSIQLLKFGSSEARLSAHLRVDGIVRAGLGGGLTGGLLPASMTTTQRDALPSGFRPKGLQIFNTTTNQPEFNAGSDAAPVWQAYVVGAAPSGAAGGDLTGSFPNPTIGAGKVDNAKISNTAAIAVTKLALPGGTTFLRADGTWAAPPGGTSYTLTTPIDVSEVHIAESGLKLDRSTTGEARLTGNFRIEGSLGLSLTGGSAGVYLRSLSAATAVVFGTRTATDVVDRFTIGADGKHLWGDGASAADVILQRQGVGTLRLATGRLEIASDINILGSPGAFIHRAATAGTPVFVAGRTGDWNGSNGDRIVVDSDGKISLGPGGGAAQDVFMRRAAAGRMEFSNDIFVPGVIWGTKGSQGGASLRTREGDAISFEWIGGSLNFYVNDVMVKSL